MRRLVKDPVAYRYEHADGLKCTMLLMNGLVRDFNFAAYVNGRARALVHPDVPAHAGRPHHAGEFLQPAGESLSRRCFSPARPPIRWSARCSPPA